jgi:Lrp/AsnC family transcriptional regulator, leucine-responsive regulatory protein
MDATDRRLLSTLQKDSSLTNLELAEKIGLSPTACLRRVKRLREEGVILRDVSLVDPAKIGQKLTAFVEVTLERHTEEAKALFLRRIVGEPAVSQCYMVTGETDAMLVLHTRDMEHYAELSNRLFASDRKVLRYRTLFSIRRIKFSTEIPLED